MFPSRRASRLACLVPAGLALMAPAVAEAKLLAPPGDRADAPAKVRSVSAPPKTIRAGRAFTASVRVRNRSERTVRPQLRVHMRRYPGSVPHAWPGRVMASKGKVTLPAETTRRFKLRVRVPSTMPRGRYYVVGCLRKKGKRWSCQRAPSRVRVMRARTPRTPPAQPPGTPPGNPGTPPQPPVPYDILVFTERAGATGPNASADRGVQALRQVGAQNGFRVTVAGDSQGVFTQDNLKQFRAVVFLNTAGDVLDASEQTAFENYFKDGGGFLGIHSAIETEPDWAFLTDLLGTRSVSLSDAAEGRIVVADRVHDASKTLPEYWAHTDRFYTLRPAQVTTPATPANQQPTNELRGKAHILATLDYQRQTPPATLSGNAHDHPVMWCKDFQGGRSFYTGLGSTGETFDSDNLRKHLAGAVRWTAGLSDPEYSDCGATIWTNYEQVKISAQPNLNEPIGFDQLPDGRIVQTVRDGRVRLHLPGEGRSHVILDMRDEVYRHSEDGMYGPAVDNDFEQNKWVYLFYSPLNMEGRQQNGKPYPTQVPGGVAGTNAPTTSANLDEWDAWRGYFQLSRFKFIEGGGGEPPRLDRASEQKIMKVEMDRGACCHVGGDIDFDKHNNLWLVTGDDTPAGGGNAGGFGVFNDQKTDEFQTVRVNNANGGTFTLTFDGQTTGPIAFNANSATIRGALEELSNVEPGDVFVNCGANNCTPTQGINGTTMTVNFDGRFAQQDVPQLVADASGLTGTGAAVAIATTQEAGHFYAPFVDARRSSLNTNDLRGKVLRIRVQGDGSYTVPDGNLFPESQDTTGQTRPEIYAMGFRNPFRIQVDQNDVAYVTDYSPDSNAPVAKRGPAGTGRVEIVRRPANYGWPVCYKTDLPYYHWDFNTVSTRGQTFDCSNPDFGPSNTSRWNTGRQVSPPITNPEIWYSFREDLWGTPCFAGYSGDAAVPCPRLFPELGQGGVGPHGADKYDYDPNNPSETKFPPYFDGAMVFGEFTRDYLREVRIDSNHRVQKINNFLDCGAAGGAASPFRFECDNPMDMQFGADGSFYLLTYGDGFFAANPDAGMYRWDYVAGPQRPRAVMSATPTSGQAPLRVQFSSNGSFDPDENDSIRFEWDFDGNGTVDSIEPNPEFVYTANGVYTPRLIVTDSTGNTDSRTVRIVVGNTAPTVTINTPVDGDFFEWGDAIPYSVTVTDPEDGAIDCSRVQATFVLVHDQHGHGEATATGCTGTLQTLAEYASHGGYIAGGISVSYTDRGGGGQPALSAQAQHIVQVRRQQPEFSQEALGVTFPNVGGGEPDPGGGQVASSLDSGDYLALNNRYYFGNMNQEITFRFAQATAAGALRGLVEVRLDAVDGPVAATCELRSTGNNNTYTNQTCPFTTPVTGSRRIYLVFRQAPGGPAAGFGNLNWVQFSGPGIAAGP